MRTFRRMSGLRRRATPAVVMTGAAARLQRRATGDVVAHARQRGAVGLALAALLAGCAPGLTPSPPGPGVPVISQFEVTPGRTRLGCPVRIHFLFDDNEGNVVRAVAHWRSQTRGVRNGGFVVLPIERRLLVGKVTGEATVWWTPPHSGPFWLHVQVEDAAGRTSNVLDARVFIAASAALRQPVPDCEQLDDTSKAAEPPTPGT